MATEIGLTAKVDPELNDKATDEEAGRLSQKMQESVNNLEAQMDVQEISQRAKDAQESAQSAGGGGGGGEEGGYGGGYSGVLIQKMDSVVSANLKQVAFIKSLSGALSNFGNTLLEKGGKFALIGTGLVLLGRLYDSASQNSALLGSTLDIFSQALGLFFRPIGRMLGQLLLPLAMSMIQLAVNFNRVFGNQGFFVALIWLADAIITGIIDGMVDIFGGGDGQGGKLGAGIRAAEFGIVATTIAKKIGAKILGLNIGKYILGSSLFTGIPGSGLILKKIIPKKMLQMTLGQALKSGIMSVFNKLGVTALASTIKSGFISIMSKLGLSGLGTALKGIIASLIKSGLGKLGISVALKGLTGKLAYFIPVVGQAIAIIDLLVLLITALIPGMEAFSPVTWVLVQTFKLLKAATFMVIDALKGFGSWIMGLLGMGGGDGSGGMSMDGVMRLLGSLYDVLKVPMMFLLPFVVIGIELFKLLQGVSWNDITSFLSNIDNKIQNFAGGLLMKAKSIWHFVESTKDSIWNYVNDKAEAIWNYVNNTTDSIWSYVSNAKDSIWSYVSNTKDSIWSYIKTTTKDLWSYVNIPDINLKKYIDFNIPTIDLDIDKPSWLGGGGGGGGDDGDNGGGLLDPITDPVGDFVEGAKDAVGLASGGIVTGPTTALIGEGGESEAVLPLSRLDSMLSTPTTNAPSPSIDASATIDTGGDATPDDIVAQLDEQIGQKLDNLRTDLQEVASQLSRMDTGEVKVTADGKVLAEINEDGKDKYKKSMEVTK